MNNKQKIVLIGASTGGPGHIKKILEKIHSDSDAIYIIVQHMTFSYMSSFVALLDSLSSIPVIQSASKMKLSKANIYICSKNSELSQNNTNLFLTEVNKESPYEPSIDLLFESATSLTTDYQITCIVLTGIGSDGAQGSLSLHKSGAMCIAESEESAIVYGMPKQTFIQNSEVKILSLAQIISYIKDL